MNATAPASGGEDRGPRRILIVLAGILIAGCVALIATAVWLALVLRFAGPSVTSLPTLVVPDQPSGSAPATPGSSTGRLEGGLTDPLLRAQVWSTIESFHTNVRGCDEVRPVNIEVTQQPDSSGSWEEAWSIVACGQAKVLKITFTVPPDGGVYYDIAE